MEAVLVFLVYDEGDSHEDTDEYNDEEDHSHRATWISGCFADDSAAAVQAARVGPGAVAGHHDCADLRRLL